MSKREKEKLWNMRIDLGNSVIPSNNHICNRGIPEEEEREKGAENLFGEKKKKLKTFLIWGRKQTSRSRRHKELPSKSTKAGHTKT